MSSKRRVFQVAREFNISIEALINFLESINFKVGSRMSQVTDEMYEEVQKEFSQETKVVTDNFDIKKELKEKRAIEAERRRKELLEYQKRMEISTKVMADGIRKKKVAGIKDVVEEKPLVEIEEKVQPVQAEPTVKEESAPAVASPDEEVKISTEKETKVKKAPSGEAKVKAKKPEKEKLEKEVGAEIEAESVEKIKPEEAVEVEGKIKEKPAKAKKIQKEAPVSADLDQKELELRVIRKIGTKKKEKETVEEEEKKADKKKKKLKRKERLKIIKHKDELEEKPAKRPKKKKKRIERVAEEKGKEKVKKKSKKKKKFVISEEEVEQSIRQTFAAMEEAGRTKKRRKKVKETDVVAEEEGNILRVNEFITVGELAEEIGVESSELIKKCMELGLLVTINQRLDKETLEIVADEFGYKVDIIPEFGSDILEDLEEEEEDESQLKYRPPVVTIMGHVDHGKTSLLDFVRKSNIIKGEAGGITQHIGAYQVNVDGKSITFLDTPGHEAFTAMRARGAQATDIVVLIVAADDSVMPQTIEAIDHARAANVPIVVAINKIDKPDANPERIKQQLADRGVLIEEWGGKHQCIEISAKTGKNVEKLLESILVEAEMLELKANPNRLARGVVIESKLDKGKGVVATVLVQNGTLKVSDPFIVGQYHGKVRSMYDEWGKKHKEAGPSVPIQVTGFTGLPQAGDTFVVLKSEKDTREISLKRQQLKREQELRRFRHMTLDEISQQIKKGAIKELSLIIKGDVDGSVEAINDALLKLSNEEVTVRVILKGVGAISESDVLLASASSAIILGFQVRPTIKAREVAKRENVDIRIYKVIYDAISDVRAALEGLLAPEYKEENLGTLEVREIFRVPKIGTVAGCYVVNGKITRNDIVRLYRDDKLLYEGKIRSLKRFKDDVKEVVSGFECGLGLENYDDIKVGDIVEVFQVIEIKRTLVNN